jgi:hypothetical protein
MFQNFAAKTFYSKTRLGDEVKIISEQSANLPDCPDLLTSLIGSETQNAASESVNVLIRLAVSMHVHGRGGSLLVVPANTDDWRESLVQPIQYVLTPPFSALAKLAHTNVTGDHDRRWEDAIGHAVDGVAGFGLFDS